MTSRLSALPVFLVRLQRPSPLIQSRGFKRWLRPTLQTLKKRKEKMDPEPLPRRSSFTDWNYKSELFAFGKRLGEDLNLDVLRAAVTTKEFVLSEMDQQKAVGIEVDTQINDNSKMIEEGNEIIHNYALNFIRSAFPKFPEEGVIAVLNYLSNDENLSTLAEKLGLADLMLTIEHPVDTVNLSNGFRAVVAAISESSGVDRANLFVRDFVMTQLVGKNINELWEINDPLRVLSSILQRDGKQPFEPRIVAEAGRNTILANYQIGLYVNKELIGLGSGESIKIATEMAARDALRELFDTTESMKPVNFDVESLPQAFANFSIQDWSQKNVEKLMKTSH
ncbi:39S ribosomal protein L44, mitochondrial-like [Nilaparvata lugens]|uniref:39S ribosomal protein L44, mitochondrial-like n=1 Tax=Nilaparvata lugens TaxID=108931 RepID=UPI00193E1D81|nr:39S ribosomal protein L44, mitochondrial-like [Nilaparvata lugens]